MAGKTTLFPVIVTGFIVGHDKGQLRAVEAIHHNSEFIFGIFPLPN